MGKWLVVAKCFTELSEVVKDVVEDARDQAEYLGIVDRLGVAEIQDGEESYYVVRKDDFEEWFGD